MSIGADLTGLQQGLDRARNLIGGFARAIGTAGRNVAEFALSLVGPQGIALSLTAVGVALVKGVVEYGSLGAAVRSLTGDLTDQEKAQKILREEFQKGFPKYAQQVSQLNILASLSNDASIGAENQAAAQKLLAQETDKVIVSQDLQKSGSEALSGEVQDYARKVLLARVTLQGFNKVVEASAEEFAKAVTEGVTFTDYFVGAVQKITGFTNALREGNFSLAKQIATTDFANLAQKRYQERVDKSRKSLENAQKETENYTRQALASGIKLEDLLNQETKSNAKAAAGRKASRKAVKDETDEIRKRNEELERFQFVFDRIRDNRIPVNIGITDLQEKAKQAQQRRKEQEERAGFFGFGEIKPNDPAIQRSNDTIDRFISEQKNKTEGLSGAILENALTVSNVFNQTLGPAIDNVFNAIDNGESVFKALGQSLKRLLVDLAATVVKAAALAAIISVISSGKIPFGAAFKIGLNAAGGPLAALGQLRGASAPTFTGGANISPSGLQLAGQVVFVQRGPDLVGVLNQGNARIGRVG